MEGRGRENERSEERRGKEGEGRGGGKRRREGRREGGEGKKIREVKYFTTEKRKIYK